MKIEQTQTFQDLTEVRGIIEQRIYELKIGCKSSPMKRCYKCILLKFLLTMVRMVRKAVHS